MATAQPTTGVTNVEPNAPNQSTVVNKAILYFDVNWAGLRVIDRDLTAPPGSPDEGDIYIPAATATGDWAGQEDDLAIFVNAAWEFVTITEGMGFYVIDEDLFFHHDGTGLVSYTRRSVETGITASTTQTQGQQPLTENLNHVGTVANANDVVTLPAAVRGLECAIFNRGANTLQIFPASGDDINDAAVDASITLAANTHLKAYAVDATSWYWM